MNLPQMQRHPASSDFITGSFWHWRLGTGSSCLRGFLEASGQSLWQVLPLGPTGYGDSPYACYSAFAGNTLLISPAQLIADGLLPNVDAPSEFPEERIDFAAAHKYKDSILRQTFQVFKRESDPKLSLAFVDFCRRYVSG